MKTHAIRFLRRHRPFWLVTAGLFSLFGPAVHGESLDRVAWLPRPQQVRPAEGRLILRDGLPVVVSPSAPASVLEIADLLREGLRATAGISARIHKSDTAPAGAMRLLLASEPDATAVGLEGYTIRIAEHAEIRAADARGLLWGVQTLLQGIETESAKTVSIACGEIVDRPVYSWRAMMLDPVRSFLDLDFIRRTIRVMSAYKLNVLHLHLIDDHAWRFESKAFPGCNPPGELFYTQAELRELVAFAARHGVEIVPEFDFPGHAHAAVRAYPELDCDGKTRPMDEAIFCAGKAFTWEFMDKVIAEAAEIFPSRYLHLGADEPFAVKRWTTCPHCHARMKEKGVTTTAALYHIFIADLNALVQRHGRRMIVWNDAITPGVEPMPPKDILVDAWTRYEPAQTLANAGYTLINSSRRPLYISSYGLREGYPLDAVWQWTPKVFGLQPTKLGEELRFGALPEDAHLLGGQVCGWATEQRLMERRLYPRALAVAETLWSGVQRGSFEDFSARLTSTHEKQLHRLGVPDDDALRAESIFDGAELPSGFAFVDGVLQASGDATTAVRTEQSYRDFILTFDRRAVRNTGRTGFIVRCSSEESSSAPRGFEVRSSPPPGMKITVPDVRDLEGWNHFELVAQGSVVSLTVNGYLAWSVVDSAPTTGAIALVGDGGGFEVKNVEVRSLDR